MALRFTNSDKWNDEWFCNLSKDEKLLFIFITDNCNAAGFIEVNKRIWSAYTGLSIDELNIAIEGIKKKVIISKDNSCLYIVNFLKHQKNLPLNPENKAHIGIIKLFNYYAIKFNITDIEDFIQSSMQGGCKGDATPLSIGIGNDNGKGKEKVIYNRFQYNEEQIRLWYKQQLEQNDNNPNYLGVIRTIFNTDDCNRLKRPLNVILSIKHQLSFNQYKELLKKTLNGVIIETLYQIQDWYETKDDFAGSNLDTVIRKFLKDKP